MTVKYEEHYDGELQLENVSLSVPIPDARGFELAVLTEATRRRLVKKVGATEPGEVEIEKLHRTPTVGRNASLDPEGGNVWPHEFFQALVGDDFGEDELRVAAEAMSSCRPEGAGYPMPDEIRHLQQEVAAGEPATYSLGGGDEFYGTVWVEAPDARRLIAINRRLAALRATLGAEAGRTLKSALARALRFQAPAGEQVAAVRTVADWERLEMSLVLATQKEIKADPSVAGALADPGLAAEVDALVRELVPPFILALQGISVCTRAQNRLAWKPNGSLTAPNLRHPMLQMRSRRDRLPAPYSLLPAQCPFNTSRLGTLPPAGRRSFPRPRKVVSPDVQSTPCPGTVFTFER